MKILVTGAGGFVGRALVETLLVAGHEVTGLDVTPAGIPEGARIVAGDLGDPSLRAQALATGCDALVHLATIPGGAAEADPQASRRINVDATYDLLLDAGKRTQGLRVVYASSIAVFADPLPVRVDDTTPISPRLIYGGHKAMMENAVAMFSNRSLIDGVTVRLPGVLARPKGPSGLKSAFMSDLFHALRAGEPFTCPVSPQGTIWAQSLACCVSNFVHALTLESACLPQTRAVTLPALRMTMAALTGEIAAQCGVSSDLVTYAPDAALEAAFATQPPLETPAALAAGFAHDGACASLVESALATLR